nr:hypothetical protein [Entomoplasma sp. MP1]
MKRVGVHYVVEQINTLLIYQISNDIIRLVLVELQSIPEKGYDQEWTNKIDQDELN